MLWGKRRGCSASALFNKPTDTHGATFESSKSLTTLEQDNPVIAVIEMSQSKWLVAAVVPGSNASRSRNSRPKRSTAETFVSLAHRSGPDGARDQARCRRLRGRTRRVLAGALAADARCRGLRYPSRKYCGVSHAGAQRLIASTQNC